MRDNKWAEEIFAFLFVVMICVISVTFLYTQRYIENTYNETAKQGIVFTRTIDLTKYKVIGNGSGLFGEYKLVTRSMTQGKDEATTIYKD